MVVNKNTSYLIGLFQTDGNMYKDKKINSNKGKFSLELTIKDSDIIYKIEKFITFNHNIKIRRKITNINNRI